MSGITCPLTSRGKEKRYRADGGKAPAVQAGWSPALHEKSGTSGTTPRKPSRQLSGRAKGLDTNVHVKRALVRIALLGLSAKVIRINFAENPKASAFDRQAAAILLSYMSNGEK